MIVCEWFRFWGNNACIFPHVSDASRLVSTLGHNRFLYLSIYTSMNSTFQIAQDVKSSYLLALSPPTSQRWLHTLSDSMPFASYVVTFEAASQANIARYFLQFL